MYEDPQKHLLHDQLLSDNVFWNSHINTIYLFHQFIYFKLVFQFDLFLISFRCVVNP